MTNEVVEVLAFILQAITQDDGTIMFQMMTQPATMLVDECIKLANEINNNADIPTIMMCMPPIVELAPAV